jgi:hypothetical protein
MALYASACYSEHMALRCAFADTMVVSVRHNDVPVTIHCDSAGMVELSKFSFSVLMAMYASACQIGHMALWRDCEDTMVDSVSHDEVAVPIHCDPMGLLN